MKSKNQSLQVLEPEVEEIPLEEVINNTLVKANVTDHIIASLKERFGDMRLKDIEDKETYLEIKDARKEVRKIGILTEKLCKKGREDAVAIQRKWLSKEKEILGKIAEVEDPLNAEIEKFENEVERKELAEQKRQEEIYINRQSTLLKLGATYSPVDNGSFVLNHISYEVELIKAADEEQWSDTILPKYRKVYEEIEAAKVAEENKRKEELAQQKKEREEFEAKQKEFKEQQELFAKQQSDLQKQKDEVERQQKLEQQKKYDEEKQKQQALISARMNQLRALGMEYSFTYNAMLFEDVNVDVQTEIGIFNDEEWNNLVNKITPVIDARKKEISEKKKAQLEKEKQAAIELAAQQEREKIAEEQRQAELKKQQDEQRKQEQLAQSNDRTKWDAFLNEIKQIRYPEFKSTIFKGKLSITKEKIDEILSL